ncbi:unnamed protein product, partial [Ilex paraguariensis]
GQNRSVSEPKILGGEEGKSLVKLWLNKETREAMASLGNNIVSTKQAWFPSNTLCFRLA